MNMKKYTLIFIFLFILISLFGCQGEYVYAYDEMIENVDYIVIEQIIIDSPSPGHTETVFIKELSLIEVDIFIDEISKVKFYYPLGDPSTLRGYVFVIYKMDGSYEKISKYITYYYTNNDESAGWIFRRSSEEDFDRILGLFIEII